jgi:cysteine desulfurase/selenocysteine lyase
MRTVAGTSRERTECPQSAAPTQFDVQGLRSQFPILSQTVHGHALVYLDSAATSQKPMAVIDEIGRYYREYNANVHRGIHHLSETATTAFERTRVKVQRFINAPDARGIVFVRGTTEAVNLVAQSFGRTNLRSGDEVLITTMEHHSNIVPWQIACQQTGAQLKVAPINDRGELILEQFAKLTSPLTKIVSLTHVSNALGTVNPVKDITRMVRDGAPDAVVMIDGAQAAPHERIDVRDLDCDFYAFSGHKMFGPTGIGALYGRVELLEAMPPWQGGGEMIKNVTFKETLYNDLPYKFEAGTPHIEGAIGLGAAIDWMSELDWRAVQQHERDVLEYGTERLSEIGGLRLIGTAAHKTAVLNFVIENLHPYEIGQIVDHEGIAIRTGHHCAQPVMERFNVPATCRASLALYNTREDVDALVKALRKAQSMLG